MYSFTEQLQCDRCGVRAAVGTKVTKTASILTLKTYDPMKDQSLMGISERVDAGVLHSDIRSITKSTVSHLETRGFRCILAVLPT